MQISSLFSQVNIVRKSDPDRHRCAQRKKEAYGRSRLFPGRRPGLAATHLARRPRAASRSKRKPRGVESNGMLCSIE